MKWHAESSAEVVETNGYQYKIRVHCYWKCDGSTFHINNVDASVVIDGDRCWSVNNIGIDTNDNQARIEIGSGEKWINRDDWNDRGVNCYADICSRSSYDPGSSSSAGQTITVPHRDHHTVSYNGNGASSGVPGAQTKVYGTVLTLSNSTPAKSGYTFNGWQASNGTIYWPGGQYGADENTTLTARWNPVTYTVTFNANGGSGAPNAQTKTYGVDLTISTVKPTRTGYDFIGWNTSSTATTSSLAPGGVYRENSSKTYYAVWTKKTYTVTFNVNGGSGTIAAQTKTYGTDLTLTSTKPTRSGYNFKGWGTSSTTTTVSYQPGGKYTSNAAITLYAIWTIAYNKPRVSSINVWRSTSNGTTQDDGTYCKVIVTWATDNTVSKFRLGYKLQSASTYTWEDKTSSVSGKGATSTIVFGSGKLAVDSSYHIQCEVSDSGGTTYSAAIPLSTRDYIIDILGTGNGMGIGKAAEIANTLDVNWDTKFEKNITINGNLSVTGDTYLKTLAPTGGDGNTTGYRVIFQETVPDGSWNNYRLVLSVYSRHSGAGIVSLGLSLGGSRTSYSIDGKYYGNEVQYQKDTWIQCYNSSTGLYTILWKYIDYNSCRINVLGKMGFANNPTNGTWMTSIPSSYGTIYKIRTAESILLYNNTNGATSCTFSESISKFNSIKIYYKYVRDNQSFYDMVEILSPWADSSDGRRFILNGQIVANGEVKGGCAVGRFTTNGIQILNGNQWAVYSSGYAYNTVNSFSIYRVVGLDRMD